MTDLRLQDTLASKYLLTGLSAFVLVACSAPIQRVAHSTEEGSHPPTAPAGSVAPFDSPYHRGTFSAVGAISSSGCEQQVPMRLELAMTLTSDVIQKEVPFRMRGARNFGPTCFTFQEDIELEGTLLRDDSLYKWRESGPTEDFDLELTLAPDGSMLSGSFHNAYHYHGGDGDNTGTAAGRVVLRK
jgi:hypothetical protein